MDTLFRKKRDTRSSVTSNGSASTPIVSPIGSTFPISTPYGHISATARTVPYQPVAGPSGEVRTHRGELISPPHTNPSLSESGGARTAASLYGRPELLNEGLDIVGSSSGAGGFGVLSDIPPRVPLKDGVRQGRRSPDIGGDSRMGAQGMHRAPSNGSVASFASNTMRQAVSPAMAAPPDSAASSFRVPYPVQPQFQPSSRDNADAASIRSVSTMSSVRDLGRYPSFSTDQASVQPSRGGSRSQVPTPGGGTGGYASRPPGPSPYGSTPSLTSGYPSSPNPSSILPQSSTASSGHPIPLPPLTGEFNFPRPPDHEIEQLFRQLLENRDLDSGTAPTSRMLGPSDGGGGGGGITPSLSSRSSLVSNPAVMARASNLPVDTKWAMVESDARSRWDAAKSAKKKEESLIKSGKIKKGSSAQAAITHTPEFYLKKCLDGNMSVADWKSLLVAYRGKTVE